jgi:NADH-quinone oxidoreductase subunit G
MSGDRVNIEVDGMPMQARRGAMLIEVTDEAGVRVPRFCYHRKLSVAANCRMCLVEVEKAPKPLPACATPVMEGMRVYTRSPKALDAQRSTMEFLLINHPLDCPICDQGGECELQDVAMGYGEDISRYSEAKRVVRDKDIGPLVATDMTRCIHCTRCVRFGEEIAGLRELGATGRGEFMEIGTFVERTLSSELSGNVIDLCPVGALTAKPSRMAARAWELVQHAGVAPHDALGSNLYLHTLRGRVIRVVPRDNEAINETWISDRDRFSYQGLYSADRLQSPMIKRDGRWQETNWEGALDAVVAGLRQFPGSELGALAAPNATLEELYLLQRIMRGIGVHNIDHRLRQLDFADQDRAPLMPWLGQGIAELEALDAALLVGSNIRKDQPIAAHRLRKAALGGARISVLSPRDFGSLFPLAAQLLRAPQDMVRALAGITAAALEGGATPAPLARLLEGIEPDEAERAVAAQLKEAYNASVLLGSIAMGHPQLGLLCALAATLAERSGARLGYLPQAANSAGAWLAGVLPHRLEAGQPDPEPGLNAAEMLAAPRKAYVLLGVEPERDCADPARARAAMEAAEFVVALSPYASETAKQYAQVLLPSAGFAETSGTYVNAEGRWQGFTGAVPPFGEARPGWKVLRVLGNLLGLEGFEYLSSEQVRDELKARFDAGLVLDNHLRLDGVLEPPAPFEGLMRASTPAIYTVDPLVRRAGALQRTPDGQASGAYLHPQEAQRLGLADAEQVSVRQGDGSARLPLFLDTGVARGCVWIPAGDEATAGLGPAFGPIELEGVS